MIYVLLWFLFGMTALIAFSAVVCIFAALAEDEVGVALAALVGVLIFSPLAVFIGLSTSRSMASNTCDQRGGEFVVYNGGASWDCLLSGDFGPLTYDQNFRIDVTGDRP